MAEVAFCQLTESEKEEILNEHNRLRGNSDSYSFQHEEIGNYVVNSKISNIICHISISQIWNDELAQVAQSLC